MRKTNQTQLAAIAILLLTATAGSAWAQAASSQITPPLVTPAAATAPAPAVAASAAKVAPQTVDAIVAVVNTDVITQQELTKRLNDVMQRMKAQNVELPPVAELQKQMLERMILERAEVQLAKENGLSVDDVMLDRAIGRIAEQNKMSMADFQRQLAQDKIPYPAFREEIRQEMLLQRLREREVDNKIQISESEVDNYITADSSSKQNAQELDLAQILVRVPENATADQIAQRAKRAEEAMQQIRSGGNFASIAAAYSDSNDALTGGDMGWRAQDRLPSLYVDAVANLSPGQVSGILKSANGFHIVKLINKRAAANAPKDTAAAPVQQTHVRHILIKVTPTVTAADARRRLLDLKERLDNNAAKFEDLAKQYSNDLSASKGGDLGWVYPGDTVPEFERAMDALKPGQVSDPIESPFGYHLIQVIERKTNDVSKERQRLAARMAIRERKTEEATNDWLRQLRDRTYVEYRNDDH
ncbi:Survival protein SurA precursor (Peptidyl-prolyl cis-trans isomerase SurA) [Collimonas arenae]|uniref:Chaperone SurA n=1 Tax=Collimonas arenae TaxID=279058 RepID=A0A0A1FEY3_9BURK|nr:peptidylprolyl isomerase [Collimonas arenae]AIY43298.1 Survival protein SurA precursor (Peptidyl-prolyl cis-trans isomerase SurA) [Collimonas arenae]